MSKRFKVLITEIAKSDITEISDYIAQDNVSAAYHIVDLFYKAFELLSNYPETGSIKNDIDEKTYAFIL